MDATSRVPAVEGVVMPGQPDWEDREIDIHIDELCKRSKSDHRPIDAAIHAAIRRTGIVRNQDGLRKALQHRKKPSPSSYLQQSDPESSPTTLRSYRHPPPPDFDDDETEPRFSLPPVGNGPTVKRFIIIPDAHVPSHHPVAVPIVRHAISIFKPHIFATVGDFLELESVMQHTRSPSRLGNLLTDDFAAGNVELDHFDEALRGCERKIFVAGNHCDRLRRYINEKAPAIDGLVTIDGGLRLRERGYEFHRYGDHAFIGKLGVIHDCDVGGVYAARRAIDAFGGSVAHGHNHSAMLAYRSNMKESFVGASLGWLGDAESPTFRYMKGYKKRREWMLGFGYGYLEVETGNFTLHYSPFIDGRVFIEGRSVGLWQGKWVA